MLDSLGVEGHFILNSLLTLARLATRIRLLIPGTALQKDKTYILFIVMSLGRSTSPYQPSLS